MTHDELRDDLIRAIRDFLGPPVTGDARHLDRIEARQRSAAEKIADIALSRVREALREPSAGMERAATLMFGTEHREHGYQSMYHGIWRAMLAARKQDPRA